MQFKRLFADHGANRGNECAGPHRSQKAAGIFNVEGIYVGTGGKLPRAINVVSIVVDRAQSKNQSCHNVLAANLLHHARTGNIRLSVVHWVSQCESAHSVSYEGGERKFHELRTGGL